MRSAAGLLTRGSPFAPSRPRGQWRFASGFSPHSGGTVPDLHRVPSPCSLCGGRPYHRKVLTSAALRLWAPVVLWAAVIFAFSSVSDLGTGLGTWDLVLRKIAHATEFAVLGALLLRALRAEWAAVAAGIAYAISDELHQHFVPGRVGSPLDVAIDAVGVITGVVLWRVIESRPRKSA